MKRIVVGVDGSEPAERAVDAAAAISAATGAELTLVTASILPIVAKEELESYAYAEHLSKQDLDRLLVDPHPSCLDRARGRAAGRGVKSIETMAMIGDPAEEIVGAADRRHADLIVVGRRGRSRLESIICGSVSQKTMQLANCPVMIIP
jgi:nucleotide-binding universal stress UspA family protein